MKENYRVDKLMIPGISYVKNYKLTLRNKRIPDMVAMPGINLLLLFNKTAGNDLSTLYNCYSVHTSG